MSEPILFYGQNRDFSEFSNWHYASFELDEKTWKTSEHYYMAMKTSDKAHQEVIRTSATPKDAKNLASARKKFIVLRSGWDGMKFEVMRKANYAKFSQNSDLKALLLSTGDRPIHEDSHDPWWGGGPNFPEGKDLLGKVLIKVRQQLRDESSP